MHSRTQWILAAGLLVAVLTLGNLPLLMGKAVPDYDAADYFGPSFSLLADHAKAGRILLWNPWVASGTPDSAEPEFGTTSPVLLVAGFLSPSPLAGFVQYWLCIWIFGAIGMLVLCRHFKCPAWGCLVASLGFITSGFYTNQAQHTAHLYSVSFLPWVLWRFDVALERRSYWCAVQSGALYGLSALGGYPVYTIVTPAFLSLWAVGRVWSETSAAGWRTMIRRLGFPVASMALFSVVGVAILSPAYVGFFTQTHGYSDRSGPRSRVEALHSNIFPAGDISTFASPYLSLVDVKPMYFWPFSDVSMRSIYSGVAVSVLALLAVFSRTRWRLWLLGLAILALCCAVAYQLPLRGWLYDYVPPTRYFRNAASFRTYIILVACILGALGAKDLTTKLESKAPTRGRFLAASVMLAMLAAWTFAVVMRLSCGLPVSFGRTLPSFDLAVAHAIICWTGICIIAFCFWRYKFNARLIYSLIIVLAVFDAVATLRVSSVTMYAPTLLRYWQAMDKDHVKSIDLSQKGLYRQLEPPDDVNLGPHSMYHSNRNEPSKVPAAVSYVVLTNRFYTQIIADPSLVKMELGNARVWFVQDAPVAPPTNDNFAVFKRRVDELNSPVVVLHSRQQMEKLAPVGTVENPSSSTIKADALPAATPAQLSQVVYRSNSLSFHYDAPENGWLIVTDRWAPGWHAKVNGKPQEVWGADFVFRAVPVVAGENYVEFRYHPLGWPYLLILSWSTLLIVLLAQIVMSLRSRRLTPAEY